MADRRATGRTRRDATRLSPARSARLTQVKSRARNVIAQQHGPAAWLLLPHHDAVARPVHSESARATLTRFRDGASVPAPAEPSLARQGGRCAPEHRRSLLSPLGRSDPYHSVRGDADVGPDRPGGSERSASCPADSARACKHRPTLAPAYAMREKELCAHTARDSRFATRSAARLAAPLWGCGRS